MFRERWGRAPDEPRVICVKVLEEYPESWPLAVFQDRLANAVAQVPERYRGRARISLDDYGKLTLSYERLQTDQEHVAEMHEIVARITRERDKEHQEYERLRRKFEKQGKAK